MLAWKKDEVTQKRIKPKEKRMIENRLSSESHDEEILNKIDNNEEKKISNVEVFWSEPSSETDVFVRETETSYIMLYRI